MQAQNIKDKIFSFTAQNKIGGNCGLGNIMLGDTYCGDQPKYLALDEIGAFRVGIGEVGAVHEINGIYHRRHNAHGITIAKEKWYCTKNPRTVPQQANRGKFGEAVAEWHGLTEQQRAVYNIESKNTRGTGFNLFIKKYMSA